MRELRDRVSVLDVEIANLTKRVDLLVKELHDKQGAIDGPETYHRLIDILEVFQAMAEDVEHNVSKMYKVLDALPDEVRIG